MSTEFYHKRASEMRTMAQQAPTADLRAAYLDIADKWERLAVTAAEPKQGGPWGMTAAEA